MLSVFSERQRWVVVALLFGLAIVNYLDRQALSILAPLLRDRFGFSAEQYSYAVASFLLAYTIGFSFSGRLLDRIGVRLAVAGAVAFWSIAGMLHATAAGWVGLAACRFLLGLGESFSAPGGTKSIGEWIPKQERAFSMAIFSTGNITGSMLAPPLVTFVALNFGWQSAFLVTGATGLLWLAAWLWFYETPERHRFLTAQERAHILASREGMPVVGHVPTAKLFRNRNCLALIAARLLTDQVPFFFSFWLPEYLRRNRNFSMSVIGMTAWIPYLAADIGGLSGGAISDWLVRRGWTPVKARRRLMLAAACTTPLAAVAVRTESAALCLACIALVLGAHSCWIVNLLTTMTEAFPRGQVGTIVGWSGMGGSIGAIAATLLTGHIVTSYGYVPVFTSLAFVHLISFGVLVRLLRTVPCANQIKKAASVKAEV